MPQQVRTSAPPKRTGEDQRPEMDELAAEHATRGDRPPVTVEDIDDFLADIDAILEENAEEFVAQYVQRGGE